MNIFLNWSNFILTIFGIPLALIFLVMAIIRLATAKGNINNKKSGRNFLLLAIIIFIIAIFISFLRRVVPAPPIKIGF